MLALRKDIMVTISHLRFLFLVHLWEISENVMVKTGSVTPKVRDALELGPRPLWDATLLRWLVFI